MAMLSIQQRPRFPHEMIRPTLDIPLAFKLPHYEQTIREYDQGFLRRIDGIEQREEMLPLCPLPYQDVPRL